MKKTLLLLLLTITLSTYAQTTTPLSKKETKEFIVQLKGLLNENNYESALKYYHDKADQINAKNIAKSDKTWWTSTQENLKEVEEKFNSNDTQINKAKYLLNEYRYWEFSEHMTTLEINPQYTYKASFEEYNSLKKRVDALKENISHINTQLPAIITLYNNKKAEQLFFTFFNDIVSKFKKANDNINRYVNPTYLPQIKAITNEYEKQYAEYCQIYENTVNKPYTTITSLTVSKDMGHAVAKENLRLINSYYSAILNNKSFPADTYPILAQRQKMILDIIPSIQSALTEVIKETDPLQTIMKGSPISYNQIILDCSKINEKLLEILSLDVCGYYNKKFSTELKRQLFLESDEHQQLYRQLKSIREEVLKTVYVSSMDVNIGQYNVKEGCFYINIGSNKGMPSILGMKPEVHHSHEIEGIVHESLNIGLSYNNWIATAYKNGNRFVYYNIKLPLDKSIAASYENTDCKLVICFTPAGTKTYRCEGASYDGRGTYDIFNAYKTCPHTTKCRVLLLTKTGEVIFDKII